MKAHNTSKIDGQGKGHYPLPLHPIPKNKTSVVPFPAFNLAFPSPPCRPDLATAILRHRNPLP